MYPPAARGSFCLCLHFLCVGCKYSAQVRNVSMKPVLEACRREIVGLGLPDDGYDYLQHLRVPGGQGRVEGLPEAADVPDEEETAGASLPLLPSNMHTPSSSPVTQVLGAQC